MTRLARFSQLLASIAVSAAAFALPATASADEPTNNATGYTVRAGDTLFGIATGAGVTLDALLAANGMQPNSLILPGQQLVLPAAPVQPSGETHTIAAGDTLGGIAARYEFRLADLLELNELTASSLILPGQRLELPLGAEAAPAAEARPAAAAEGPAAEVLEFALAQVGKPYRFFTKGPAVFDCSGLTLTAYARVGVTLVHHAATQATQGGAVDFWNSSIRAGDLVFLDDDWNGQIDHVGIAIDSGSWVHASESRGAVVTGPLPSKSVIVAVRRYVSG